ncbi:hypothetical protein ACFYM3_34360 [Streptomyces massasporeus]|uniref:Major facilitator superfamily (MFS) profile domain-containing protein n=1 Tax=Streptomyces massasporeus TaxID=67324 RepID=A0ABW6LN48_9ACTN
MLVGSLSAGILTDWLGRRLTLVSSVTPFSIGSAICATAGGVGPAGSSPASGWAGSCRCTRPWPWSSHHRAEPRSPRACS